MNRLPWGNKYFSVTLGLLVTISIKYCINVDSSDLAFANSFWSAVFWVGYCYILINLVEKQEWKGKILPTLDKCLLSALLFSGAMVAGVQLNVQGFVDFTNVTGYFAVLILGIGFSPIFAGIMACLDNIPASTEKTEVNSRYFWSVWIILVISYIVVLLAVWPGFFSYDAGTETYMVFTNKYSAHHPVLHVLLLGWILRMAYHFMHSYNAGIVIYLVLQIAVVAGCFSYMIYGLRKMGVRRFLCNIGIAFLALCPTVSMFVCCTTKDVYFSGGVILLTTSLLEMVHDSTGFWLSRQKKLVFLIASLFVLFFRNNGIYAYVLFIICLLLVYRRNWKKWASLLLAVFVLFGIVTGILTITFQVKSGEVAEMLCVPMQQLARMHSEAKESFDEEELETLYSLIPEVVLDNYNPKLADDIKFNFLEDNFKASTNKYISLWLHMGLKRPDIYINSFLINTYGYWYPDTIPDGYVIERLKPRYYGESSYFEYCVDDPAIKHSYFPMLERFYEKISLHIYQQKIPVISMLFSMGFWKWMYVFAGAYLLIYKEKKLALCFAPMAFLYLTVLLGPIALVRYVLYFFFGVPILLALLFDRRAFA